MLATRDRAEVLAELATLNHEAGRMTTRDDRYERLHGAIDVLLGELETCDSR